MFVFRKIWYALLSCYLRFEVRLFALLPTKSFVLEHSVESDRLIQINHCATFWSSKICFPDLTLS